MTTVINWPWSTDGSPPCHHLEACCRITTGPCPCRSGQASIQKWVGNPAASHYPGTVGSTPSWLLPPLRLNIENPSIIAWSGPGILVRSAESSYPKKYLREQNIASKQNDTTEPEANRDSRHLRAASFHMMLYYKHVLTYICIFVIPSSVPVEMITWQDVWCQCKGDNPTGPGGWPGESHLFRLAFNR